MYILGDSISYLSGSWAFQLAQKAGCEKIYNLARGGAKWADPDNIIVYNSSCSIWSNPFQSITSDDGLTESYPANSDLSYNVIPTDNSQYTCISNEIRFMNRLITSYGRPVPDTIVFACGINDTRNTTETFTEEAFNAIVQTPYESMTGAQMATLSGGLRYNIERAMRLWPNAQIILVTPIQSAYDYLRPYIPNTCEWIRAFSTYYATRLIDAYSESGITAVFEKGWGESQYTNPNNGRYLYDGLHPNDDGKRVMGNYMAKEIIQKQCDK